MSRTHGTLTKWNDDRGFGFITPGNGRGEIFVHVSAFPRQGGRPQIGELISFEIETDARGRQRAVRLMRPGKPTTRASNEARSGRGDRAPRYRHTRWTRFRDSVTVVTLVTAALYGYSRIADHRTSESSRLPVAQSGNQNSEVERTDERRAFNCDGRTRCPEMHSCEEAVYFLQHCPGTQMDGDGDGVPCEDQHCGH